MIVRTTNRPTIIFPPIPFSFTNRTKCGNGPNICVIKNGDEKVYSGISDATSASAVLDVAFPDASFPIELLVAADVISKVGSSECIIFCRHCCPFTVTVNCTKSDTTTHTQFSAKDMTKKEQLLTSAITQLTKDENHVLSRSYAHGHALYLRADIRLDKTQPDVEGALNDSRLAVQFVPKEIKAWRVLASAEEAAGNLDAAILAVRKWIEVDHSFATKANCEIERLVSKK